MTHVYSVVWGDPPSKLPVSQQEFTFMNQFMQSCLHYLCPLMCCWWKFSCLCIALWLLVPHLVTLNSGCHLKPPQMVICVWFALLSAESAVEDNSSSGGGKGCVCVCAHFSCLHTFPYVVKAPCIIKDWKRTLIPFVLYSLFILITCRYLYIIIVVFLDSRRQIFSWLSV